MYQHDACICRYISRVASDLCMLIHVYASCWWICKGIHVICIRSLVDTYICIMLMHVICSPSLVETHICIMLMHICLSTSCIYMLMLIHVICIKSLVDTYLCRCIYMLMHIYLSTSCIYMLIDVTCS